MIRLGRLGISLVGVKPLWRHETYKYVAGVGNCWRDYRLADAEGF